MKKKAMSFFTVIVLIFGMVTGTELINGSVPTLPANQLNSYDLSSFYWTTTEVVSTESIAISTSPSIGVDSLGNVHIAWHDYSDYDSSGSDQDIYYKMLNSSSSTWSITEVLSDISTMNSVDPHLAVDESDNVHVVWYDWTDYDSAGGDADIFYRVLDSTTKTWSSIDVVSTESTLDSGYPDVAIDRSENVYVVWTDWTDDDLEGDSDIYFKYWDSSTSSWSVTDYVSTESTDWSQYPSLAIDFEDTVHVTWYDSTNYDSAGTDQDVFYKKWSPITSVWSLTEVVSTESTAHSFDPKIATDTEGTLHIAWSDESDYASSDTDTDIFYKYWDSSTSLWSISEVVSMESTEDSYTPSITVDYSDTIHIAWSDFTNFAGSGADFDIFYKLNNPLIGLWTLPQIASHVSSSSSMKPSITVDELGTLFLTWADLADYEGSGTDIDVFFNKFVGRPDVPSYISATPIYSTDGIIELDWSDSPRATDYYIYRNTTYILPNIDYVPIAKIVSSNFTDTISVSGIYHYAVVAENAFGNSSLSNIVSVQVELKSDNLLSFISDEGLILFGVLLGIQVLFFVTSLLIKRRK
jgi:hypothetical protein